MANNNYRGHEKDPLNKPHSDVSTVHLGPKRTQNSAKGPPPPPHIFVVTIPNGDFFCYYFNSDDVGKRRLVLDTIVRYAKADEYGPRRAFHLLDLLSGYIADNELRDDIRDEIIEIYMALYPQEGEWTHDIQAKAIAAQPGSVITSIDVNFAADAAHNGDAMDED